MSAPDFELPPVEAPFQVPADPEPHHGMDRDGGILIPPAAGADEPWTYVSGLEALNLALAELLSSGLNLSPVGPVKGVIEAFEGEDLITGRELEWWERALNIAAAVPIPEVEEPAAAAKILHALHAIHQVIDAVHEVHHAHELGEAAHHVGEAAGHMGQTPAAGYPWPVN